MKTITIRLPDVEAAMLNDLKRRSEEFRDLDSWLAARIHKAHENISRK